MGTETMTPDTTIRSSAPLPDLETLDRSNSGWLSHSRRVAVLAMEVGTTLIEPAHRELLAQAALLHHYPTVFLKPDAWSRMLADLYGPEWRSLTGCEHSPEFPPAMVAEVLRALHSRRAGTASGPIGRIADLLEVCCLFDERLEFLPFEDIKLKEILTEFDLIASSGIFDAATIRALRRFPLASLEQVNRLMSHLPVFPAVAVRVLSTFRSSNSEVSPSQLEALAGNDQVLAGEIIHAANSCVYGVSRTISRLGEAIVYIGSDTARNLLIAAAMKPLFASVAMRDLWRHSLDVAQLAHTLAVKSDTADRDEAFLVGLVHDAGRLLLSLLPREIVELHARVTEQGGPALMADLLVSGVDHAELSAMVLKKWKFPEHLVEAAALHHKPELSREPLASILYLAEILSGAKEDIHAGTRIDAAMTRLHLTAQDLVDLSDRTSPAIDAIRGAA